jgi:hypothetical protein
MSAAPDTPPVVVLLGFHRSGTSMVMRMLNLLGVGLGDEAALLPPQERDNARGYWEPRWMIELNEELLAALGGGTFEPFTAAPGWERSPELEPLRERARALLERHFEGETRWGWKDPRTSLTLPFWREVVGRPLTCVVCVRSPADAVASALRRGIEDIHRWQYAERWLDYTALALAQTAPDERTLVFYEDVLTDPAGKARRLAELLGLDEPSAERLEAVVASVDPALRHHMTSPWDVAVDSGLPLAVRLLYLLLRAGAALPEDAAAVRPALERVAGELREARQARQHADAEHQRMSQELAAVRAEAERLGGELKQARAVSAQREQALSAREQQLAQREEQLAERDARIAELDGALAEAAAALTQRDAALADLTGSRSWRLTQPLRALRRR